MRAVSHCHERALKGMAINFPADLHQTTGSKEANGVRPANVRPAAFSGALLQFGSKRLIQHVRVAVRFATARSFPGYSSKIRRIFTLPCDHQGRVTCVANPSSYPLSPKRSLRAGRVKP